MTTALVFFCHGNLGESILGAVEGLFGPAEDVAALSNRGLSRRDMSEELRRAISGFQDVQRVVILADLVGGSCWQVAMELSRREGGGEGGIDIDPEVAVIGGVNLRMAMASVHKRDIAPLSELVTVLIAAGRDGVR